MDHHHHRPTTRRQALGEINGNLRGGGNTHSKDAVKKGYVRKNHRVSSSKRVKLFFILLLHHHLSREREMRRDGFFFSKVFPLSLFKGEGVPRFSKVRTTYTLYILLSTRKLLLLRFITLKTKQRGSATRIHPNQIWSHAESADSKFL
jgi:hypothetical protein